MRCEAQHYCISTLMHSIFEYCVRKIMRMASQKKIVQKWHKTTEAKLDQSIFRPLSRLSVHSVKSWRFSMKNINSLDN